jgi:MFS family permease
MRIVAACSRDAPRGLPPAPRLADDRDVALLGAGIAATGLAPTLPVLLAVMVAVGVVEGAGTTYLISWMQRRTDPGMQGRVMSLALLASVGLEPVALALAGVLASRELGLLFWVSAITIELTALLASLSRSVREVSRRGQFSRQF